MRAFIQDLETGRLQPVMIPNLSQLVVSTVDGKFALAETEGHLDVRGVDGTLVLHPWSSNVVGVELKRHS